MPIIKAERWEQDKPDWCKFSAYGLYKLARGKKEEDYHFHDCDEYFIVTEGRAPFFLEGTEYEIAPVLPFQPRLAQGPVPNRA